MSDDCADFKPSEAQEKLLKYLQGEDYQPSISAACAACEIGRRTYYLWLDHPEFCEWWSEQAERYFASKLPKVQAIAYAAAIGKTSKDMPKYNPAAIKLFLERFDKRYMPKTAQEITGRLSWAQYVEGPDGDKPE